MSDAAARAMTRMLMQKKIFLARVRHLCWCCYQLGCGQAFNIEPTKDQFDSLLDGVTYLLDNPGISPEENHINWMKMKIEQGWRLRPVKDAEKKEHPDLVPYKELPKVEREKDAMDIIAHEEALKIWNEFIEGTDAAVTGSET